MELIVLGSSSRGNCYILNSNTEALVIEAGVSLLEVKKAVGFNISKIRGVLVSHEHSDHSKYVNDFLKAQIPVYASIGTMSKVTSRMFYFLEGFVKKQIGNFTVLPFDVKHDAAEPLGFLIKHEEIGTMLFATDTYYLPYKFEGLTNILIECNYRLDLLTANVDAGRIPVALRNRTLESHLSYHNCRTALMENDLSKVNNIVLIHLSDNNSNAAEFREGIHRATGKQVHVADKGMKIQINKQPF
jgi:phosphoribosyl 1,2-cyclic phosphodiesterase